MSLDINGYNDTFRAFTDFAKVMTQRKGGSAITSSEMRHAVRMGENSTVQFVGGL